MKSWIYEKQDSYTSSQPNHKKKRTEKNEIGGGRKIIEQNQMINRSPGAGLTESCELPCGG